jgi:ketosteroid isomerase-like protein
MTCMKRTLMSALVILIGLNLSAQEAEIRAAVDRMFAAMYARDTAALRACFTPAAILFTFSHDSKGNPRAKGEAVSDFIRGVSLIGEEKIDERLTAWHCLVDDGIASVWTPYQFYVDEKFSHCGVNSFELIQVQGKWKITALTDTRRKGDCVDQAAERMAIDSLMDAWHHAAAVADEAAFFGFMTADAVYIGTDPTERWSRDELRTWSEKYFARESAWDFKPVSRNVTFGPDGAIAWIDELLDTWMGPCRSTGILRKSDGAWHLVYYHLSMAVPNDRVDDYRLLLEKK